MLHTLHFIKETIHMKYNDTLQCFKNMFQATQAHEWMNDAHVYEMQVQMWKPNTWGVTALPPYKKSHLEICQAYHC